LAAYELQRKIKREKECLSMSDQPFDPAANQAAGEKREQADTYDGQSGYGVQYEDGQYQNESAEDMEGSMRSGSFETDSIANQTASYGYPQAGSSGDPSSAPSSDPDEPLVQPE
jgi:hypothetical protein